jgi:hypothetical protein
VGKKSDLILLGEQLEREVSELRAGRVRSNDKVDAKIEVREDLIEMIKAFKINGKDRNEKKD